MKSSCRILTAVALLLHSILGCGMHAACGCSEVSHSAVSQTDHTSTVAVGCCEMDETHPDVHRNHDDSKHFRHEKNRGESGNELSTVSNDGTLKGKCGCCQRVPDQDHHPSDRCGLACNFVPSSDVVLHFDAPLIEYLGPSDLALRGRIVERSIFGPGHGNAFCAGGPISFCASHCTWRL